MSTAVVGGGLAGLVAGYRLAQAGQPVLVLEAAPALGGMIRPVDVGGIVVDSGAEAYAVRGGVARALCDELGLAVAAPQGRPHVFFGEGAYPMAEGMLGIPASSGDPAWSVLDGPERAEALRDLDMGPGPGASATSVGELVRTRMGEAAVAKLVAPVAYSIYGSAPDKLALADVAPALPAALAAQGSLMSAVASVRTPGGAAVEQPIGGMFRMIDALERAIESHGGKVLTGTAVVAIRRHASGFLIITRDGDQREADHVVLAGPASASCSLLGRVGVDFTVPPVREARLITLAVNHPALLEAPIGSGALVAQPADALAAKAITHYSVKWPWAEVDGTSVLRLSYPGMALPGRAEAIAEASRLTGVTIDDRDVLGIASVGWHAMPTRLEASRRDYLVEAAAAAGVDVVGAWVDGNGIASVIAGCERVVK